MKWGEVAWWKEVDRSDAFELFHIHIFVFQIYKLNMIIWRNMNCHTESIFTGHFVHWCLKVCAGKIWFFKSLEVDILSPWHAMSGLLLRAIFLYLRNHSAVELIYNNDGLRNPLLWRITDKVLNNDKGTIISLLSSFLSTLSMILHNNGFLKPSLLYCSSN